MFDYRYHALSLAAVLFALALAVLIGVAIGDTNLASPAKSGLVHNLNSEVSEARTQAEHLQDRLTNEEAFAKNLYPLAVHELLNGRSIGLVFLGEPSDQVNSLVRAAVTQGNGTLATVVAVRLPLNLPAIDREAAGTHYSALQSSPQLLESFGRLVGRQLVSGGQLVDKELLSRVRGSLLSAFDAQLTHLEGPVVAPTRARQASAERAAARSPPPLLRLLRDGGHTRPNYRGRPLPFPLGVLIPAAAVLALVPLTLIARLAPAALFHPEIVPILVYALGVALLGLIDDTLGADQGSRRPAVPAVPGRPATRGWRGPRS